MDREHYFIAHASSPTRVLACFRDWKTCEREQFITWQYRVYPAFLDFESDRKTIKNEAFDARDVIPLLEDVETEIGSSEVVYKVRLEKQCHGFFLSSDL